MNHRITIMGRLVVLVLITACAPAAPPPTSRSLPGGHYTRTPDGRASFAPRIAPDPLDLLPGTRAELCAALLRRRFVSAPPRGNPPGRDALDFAATTFTWTRDGRSDTAAYQCTDGRISAVLDAPISGEYSVSSGLLIWDGDAFAPATGSPGLAVLPVDVDSPSPLAPITMTVALDDQDGAVIVRWSAPRAPGVSYRVLRRRMGREDWTSLGDVAAQGDPGARGVYEVRDRSFWRGAIYTYAVRVVENGDVTSDAAVTLILQTR